jgi:hypothetical protein
VTFPNREGGALTTASTVTGFFAAINCNDKTSASKIGIINYRKPRKCYRNHG